MLSNKEIEQRLSEIAGYCIEIRKMTYLPKGVRLTRERLDEMRRLLNKAGNHCDDLEIRGLEEKGHGNK